MSTRRGSNAGPGQANQAQRRRWQAARLGNNAQRPAADRLPAGQWGNMDSAALRRRLRALADRMIGDDASVRGVVEHAPAQGDRNTGFSSTLWRDGNNMNLYMRNLADDGGINPNNRPTFDIVKQLTARSISNTRDIVNDPMPTTVVMETADTPASKINARNLLQTMINDAERETGQRYQLDEAVTNNPAIGNRGVNPRVTLTYSITPLERKPAPQIMNAMDFKADFPGGISGGAPERIRIALHNFKMMIVQADRMAFNIEQTTDTVNKAGGAEEVNRAAAIDAQARIAVTLETLTREIDEFVSPKNFSVINARELKIQKGFVKRLKKQITQSQADLFRTELDIVRAGRIDRVATLKDSQIIPGTTKVLGSGGHGDVKQSTLLRSNGQEFTAVLKPNTGISTESVERQRAIDLGMPVSNINQAQRAVALSKLNDEMDLQVIPKTELTSLKGEDGRPQLGQAMEVVKGYEGQRKVRNMMKNMDGEILDQEIEAGQLSSDQYIEVDGKKYYAVRVPPNVRADNVVVQKGLADLQVIDVIAGHFDRNPGNFIFQINDDNQIIGVKGIDNDDVFAKNWRQYKDSHPGEIPTPGIPPIIDIETARKILTFDSDKINGVMDGLASDEKDATKSRLSDVKAEIAVRFLIGNVAATNANDTVNLVDGIKASISQSTAEEKQIVRDKLAQRKTPLSDAKRALDDLDVRTSAEDIELGNLNQQIATIDTAIAQLANMSPDFRPNIRSWGTASVENAHEYANSYLGQLKDAQTIGTYEIG